MNILSPLPGRVLSLSDVSDPVFAKGMMGPGIAIIPAFISEDDAPRGTKRPRLCPVYAPIEGTIIKVLPHAFIVQAHKGLSVLIHLGIDTCHQCPEAFDHDLSQGDRVTLDEPIMHWDPQILRERDVDTTVIIAALECPSNALTHLARVGSTVAAHDVLFSLS